MTSAPEPLDAVIIGAGISGLASAHWLMSDGHRVRVFERDDQPGGTMKTHHENGFLVEAGPNSALETTPLFKELFESCGLQSEVEYAAPVGKNRFIVRNNRLHALPLSPPAFLRSRLFTLAGKLRLLAEPFIGRAREEESVAQFVSRRLGQEFLDYAIDPFVAGVFAGRPEDLSVRSAFPKLYALEETYGGLVRGMIGGARERKKRAEKAKDRAESFSFRSGMQALPNALAASLGDSLSLSSTVRSVQMDGDGYRITYVQDGQEFTVAARSLVFAVPAPAAADLLDPHSTEIARSLRSIEYSPVASVFLGFERSAIDHPLDGFGVLIPQKENKRILGALWSSSLFTNRAPEDRAAFTVFVGGARQPEHLSGNDEELLELCVNELASIMHILGKPVYYRITRWEKAIPQYKRGHTSIMDAIDTYSAGHPGLSFCSNYRGGISVGDCVMSARRTADAIAAHIHSRPA